MEVGTPEGGRQPQGDHHEQWTMGDLTPTRAKQGVTLNPQVVGYQTLHRIATHPSLSPPLYLYISFVAGFPSTLSSLSSSSFLIKNYQSFFSFLSCFHFLCLLVTRHFQSSIFLSLLLPMSASSVSLIILITFLNTTFFRVPLASSCFLWVHCKPFLFYP